MAAECVVLAETKDHMNWDLIGTIADKTSDKNLSNTLKQAHEAVAEDEGHHLYHTKGWGRELWIKSLGFPAVLPPPEEQKQVATPYWGFKSGTAAGQNALKTETLSSKKAGRSFSDLLFCWSLHKTVLLLG